MTDVEVVEEITEVWVGEEVVEVALLGASGPSEYDTWLSNGNMGSYSDFLNAMIGAANLTVTGAAGQSVGSRALLAAIASPVAGQTAYLAEAGREGWFKFSTSNLSAAVTSDPNQGLYVAPATATSGASGAWVRVREPGYFRASWFGFVMSSAAAEAANTARMTSLLTLALAETVSVVEFDSGELYTQVLIPPVPIVTGDPQVSLTLRGRQVPSLLFGTVGDFEIAAKGSVLRSNATTKAVIYQEPFVSGFGNFSLIQVNVENVIAWTYDNPQISGIHLENANMMTLRNLKVTTGLYGPGISEPTHLVPGVRTPLIDNGAIVTHDNLEVSGYYSAITVNEHQSGNVVATLCKYALEYLQANHASNIAWARVQKCVSPMVFSGAHTFFPLNLNIERRNAGSGSENPSTAWADPGFDIVDPSNFGKGQVRFASVLGYVPAQDDDFSVSGANSIVVRYAGETPTPAFILPINTSIPNATDTYLSLSNTAVAGGLQLRSGDATYVDVTRACVVDLSATMAFAATASGALRVAIIYIAAGGGSPVSVGRDVRSAISGESVSLEARCPRIHLKKGDALRVVVSQTSGGALNLLATDYSGKFTISIHGA